MPTAPATIDDFLDLGYKGGVLEKPAVEALQEQLRSTGNNPETPTQFADALLRAGLLTRFQADFLLAHIKKTMALPSTATVTHAAPLDPKVGTEQA